MIINKITITDFGVYGGKNEFDFKTTPEKTVILCGGKNGAGKTTLFESIMLCFYGKDFDDSGREKEYNDKILRSFHRNLSEHTVCEESSISIEFDISFDGKIQEYQITRTWQNNEGKIDEFLSVKKSDAKSNNFQELDVSIPNAKSWKDQHRFEEMDSIDKSDWQQFINQLIPRGIAKLFFFDGEKIQSIADDNNENKYIQSSFDTLLGLDIVHQLQKDLGHFLSTISKTQIKSSPTPKQKGRNSTLEQLLNNAPNELDAYLKFYTRDQLLSELSIEDLEPLLSTHEKLEKDIQEKDTICKKLKMTLTNVQNELLLTKEKFQKIGGGYYKKHEDMEQTKENISSKIAVTEKEIRDLCSTELPFCLISKQMQEIKNQLESDQKIIHLNYEQEIIEKQCNKISSVLNSESFLPEISQDFKKSIDAELVKILKNELKNNDSIQSTFFNLSQLQMEQILTLIENAKTSTIDRIHELTNSYNVQKNALEKIDLVRKIRPDVDEIKSIMDEMENTTTKKGKLETELDELELKLSQRKTQLGILNARIRSCLNLKKDHDKSTSSEKIAYSVLEVLDDYSQLLRKEKITTLEENVLKGLGILLHKKDFVHKVTIDKYTFEVTLYNAKGDEITKNMLSKGELQIYATALVWGLAKTSGRTLPFMIDTPLARLDVEHREKLVESFFPRTSQQTIILSTNSEIDFEYYKKLEPFISKSYVIEYDDSKGKTRIRDGYFGKNEGEMAVEVL
ncbi:DNA sulfur modification protein DndD [Candidatus Nitrosopumilus salaria BD31]|uniref:DNA sulfur modification protein DndD n=1 Tax=Candidatus Nitrosopumilus salarius BD31 TaxID=859350 RepID=I3CZX3_9ARCH|nr:DNA sulfur modification protein DndD [Candidatus Nitrosopumilus salaria]EIJ65016.1 DNA sulfur modification protein DndD [Candidatus Nitrosopumilus salaria BD31]